MAFYDPVRRCVTLRLVYDGLGTAGKTTNVRQAHALFTLARRGEVFAPAEERGRTLFFDWLELEAGVVDDRPLRCQVLTVPGQFLYVQRRYELLRSADAIVLVCDSSPAGIVRSRYAFRFLRRMMEEGACSRVPIVVQANKQDIPGALPGSALAVELGLEPGMPVIEATASTGEGVRATLVYALQAARDGARELLNQGGLEALPVKNETPEQVYTYLLRHENDPEGAMLADSVIASFLDEDAPESVVGLGLTFGGVLRPSEGAGAGGPGATGDEPVATGAMTDEPVAAGATTDEPVAAGATPAPPIDAAEGPTSASDDLLPQRDLPPGSVWPPAIGPTVVRQAIAQLAPGARLPRTDDESTELELRAGDAWTLLTSPSLVFSDETRARFALDDMVRARVAAGDLLPSSTVFALRGRGQGGPFRLWTIRPKVAPLFDEDMGPPADMARRHEVAELLATALARAVALAARHGVVMKVSPRRIGVSAGAPVYLGLLYGPEGLDAGFIEGALRWADRAADPGLAELFATQLVRALQHHTTAPDLRIVGFTHAVSAFRPSTDAGERLVEATLTHV